MKANRVGRLWMLAALAAACGLCFAPVPETQGGKHSPSIAVRLFGPIAVLAASAQWVRADVAFRNGRVELYLARARTALALAPGIADGWTSLAKTQAYSLGSPEREPDPVRRLAWIRAGLATAAEGERAASNPGEMALQAGLIMVKVATIDPRLPWPGGLAAIWDAAASHFDRALSLGYDANWASTLSIAARRAAAHARDRH